jgi:hypothetical protein
MLTDTLRYDTGEVENGLKASRVERQELDYTVSRRTRAGIYLPHHQPKE